MTQKKGQPPDDVSSAPESGTVRDETSGNQPSERGVNPGQGDRPDQGQDRTGAPSKRKDDPSVASEEA